MQTTIYVYNVKDRKVFQNIQFTAVRLGCKVKVIPADMADRKVGYIAGLEGFTAEASGPEAVVPEESVMLLGGFTGAKLDELLKGLRRAGVPRSILKAMLNENNQDWYFYELCEELKREHEEMNKAR